MSVIADAQNATMLNATNSTMYHSSVIMNTAGESDVIMSTNDVSTSPTKEDDVMMSNTQEVDVALDTTEETDVITVTQPDNLVLLLSHLSLFDCQDELYKYHRSSYTLEFSQCVCSLDQYYCVDEKYKNMDPEIFKRLADIRFKDFGIPTPFDNRTTAFRAVGIFVAVVGILG